jgi:hypothetical protein
LETTSDIEDATLFYANYAGYFGSQAYTDASNIYNAIINDPTNPVPTLPGSPILILDSTFN